MAEAVGEIEKDEGVLVIRRIHVKMLLKANEDQRATAERVHGMYADRCPVYRSLRDAIAITTELIFDSVTESP